MVLAENLSLHWRRQNDNRGRGNIYLSAFCLVNVFHRTLSFFRVCEHEYINICSPQLSFCRHQCITAEVVSFIPQQNEILLIAQV